MWQETFRGIDEWNKSPRIDFRDNTNLILENIILFKFKDYIPDRGNRIKGDNRIIAEFKNKAIADIFLQGIQANNLEDKCKVYGDDKFIALTSNKIGDCMVFLKLLLAQDNSINGIIKNVCRFLEMNPILIYCLGDLEAIPFNDIITAAEESQKSGHYEFIEKVITVHWEASLKKPLTNEQFEMLLKLIELVSVENPFYTRAKDIGVGLLMNRDVILSLKTEPNTQTESKSEPNQNEAQSLDESPMCLQGPYEENLKLKFKYAVSGTDQDLTDLLYNELCGFTFGSRKISNVKGDYEFLLQQAASIKELLSERDALKEELSSLKMSISTHESLPTLAAPVAEAKIDRTSMLYSLSHTLAGQWRKPVIKKGPYAGHHVACLTLEKGQEQEAAGLVKTLREANFSVKGIPARNGKPCVTVDLTESNLMPSYS